MTTNDTRLDVPPLDRVLDVLVNFATTYPDYVSQHAYVTVSAHTGEPLAHDLIGHLYKELGGDLHRFLGEREETGTPRNTLVVQLLWEHLFKEQPALFFGLRANEQTARNLLVYWTLARVQKAQDKSDPWQLALRKGLQSTRTLVNHRYSGFLVQTHGEHVAVRDEAVALLTAAINKLK